DEVGETVPLPASPAGRITPLAMVLQPGAYFLTLRHPDRPEPLRSRVDIPPAGETRRRVEMHDVTVDAFLRELERPAARR
ncbi:MAG: hypothetical protein MI919_27410, partial [Holophagales bacterium]|nr:hypothetical protein [Holophagales bacterium]